MNAKEYVSKHITSRMPQRIRINGTQCRTGNKFTANMSVSKQISPSLGCTRSLQNMVVVTKTRYNEIIKQICLLYTSDAADEEDSVDLGGRRIIKKKYLNI